MKPDRKIDIEIFNAALAIESGSDRQRYLDEACVGDAERRQRIESLLEAYTNTDSFFDAYPRTNQAKSSELKPLTEGPGDKIGPYKLLQEIGEGGMGVVYMAQQEEPVQRKVALKIIKVGMDTRQVVARFEAERQALAMMDHPNIAKVFDGGCTESGRPYFVMELVQGVPITEFCDKNRLSAQERIQLLIPVCQAIQSAHQKGIIHRDIKPSNVLVTLHHGESQAMVIDFGVAKATNQKLTEKTLFTSFGMMVGTPVYMSPEQAQLSTMDVDTRTDVYSLGVLLYELLTGTTPFDQKQLLSKGYGEMRRVIAEEELDKPSFRMSTLLAEKRTAIAKNRSLHAPELVRILKGDLDCITMKCVEKDRRRRYDTPNELIADLKRHLNHETVLAAPPTLEYRFKKFYQRKKGLVHALAAIGLTLILATVVSVGMAIRMSQLRNEAVQAGKKALTQAAVADAVNQFLNEDLLNQANPWNEPDPDIKLRTVVDRAAKAIEGKFKEQPLVEASIRRTLGDIYGTLDDLETAKRHRTRAREIYERELGKEHPDTLKSRLRGISDLLGASDTDKSKSDEACSAALDLLTTARRVFVEEHEIILDALRTLGNALGSANRYRERQPVLENALALHEKVKGKYDPATIDLLGDLCWNHISLSGQTFKAVDFAREAVKRSDALREDHPVRYKAKEWLSLAYGFSGGDRNERRRLAQENLEFARRVFGPEHSKTISALENRALAATNNEEGLALIGECYQLALKRWGPRHRRALQVQRCLAESLAMNGDRKKSEELLLSGLELMNANFNRNDRLRVDYLCELGRFHIRENPEKAEAYLEEAASTALEFFGDESELYQRALVFLQWIYSGQRQWAKQADVQRSVFRARMKNLGTRQPRTTAALTGFLQCLAVLGRANEADEDLRAVLTEFAKSPPQSEAEWDAAKWAVLAFDFSVDKKKTLHLVEAIVRNPSTNSMTVLSVLGEYQRHAGDLKAYQHTRELITTKDPDNHINWYTRSAAAINIGDTNDHFVCSREMLTRFGHEEKDNGMMERVLKTMFIVAHEWTPGDLAKARKLYERLNSALDKAPADPQQMQHVWYLSALSLADYRLGKYEKALERFQKVTVSTNPMSAVEEAHALAVLALCRSRSGENEKAIQALRLSDKRIENSTPFNMAHFDHWRRDYLVREATQLIQSKSHGSLTNALSY